MQKWDTESQTKIDIEKKKVLADIKHFEELGELVEQVAADGDTQKTDAVGTAADSNHGQCDEVTSV